MDSLKNLIYAKQTKRKRVSSYDRTGGNDDRYYIAPGETVVIADIKGAGIINHIWMTHQNGDFVEEKNSLRKIQLKMYWDGEENPSVLAPLGDFFGMGHGLCKNYVSAPLQMSPQDGKALNSWWQMPFGNGAKIEITNECDQRLILYFYIDYEELESYQKIHYVSMLHGIVNYQLKVTMKQHSVITMLGVLKEIIQLVKKTMLF